MLDHEQRVRAMTMTKKKILLVDDIQLFLEHEKTLLDREEFEFICARSGKEALESAIRSRPDLILIDFFMPDMNGDKCCRLIKSSAELRDIPVVMVTSGGGEDCFKACWQAGCDDIIVKPINPHFFVAIVEKYLPVTERKAPRFIARLRVQYGPDRETTLEDYSLNLSTGGLFLATFNLLPVGTCLNLGFIFPHNETSIRCEGRIAWVNHPELMKNQNLPVGMGIQFINLSLDQMNCIRDFIKNGTLVPFW